MRKRGGNEEEAEEWDGNVVEVLHVILLAGSLGTIRTLPYRQ